MAGRKVEGRGVGVREKRAARGDCAALGWLLLCCNNNVDAGRVIESVLAVEGGSVTELGGACW
jgi:hypothetical protein